MSLKTACFALLAIMVASACVVSNGHTSTPTSPSTAEIAQFQKVFMSSYYAERPTSGMPAGSKGLTPFLLPASAAASRATVPVNSVSGGIPFGAPAPTSFSNYPEPGQTTSFTLSLVATTGTAFKVYDVTATTSFPNSDLRKTYVEEYYVADVTANPGYSSTSSDMTTGWTGAAFDGTWTTDDPIVTPDGTSSTGWRWNQAARKQMTLNYRDGTARSETIVSMSTAGGPKLDPAAFDVSGSLDLSQAFLPATTSDSSVFYSSVVIYKVQPSINYNFWFWAGSQAQTILGIRYYTERASVPSGTYTTYTASFEKTVSAQVTSGGSYTSTVQGVLVGSEFDSLAETVLRQQVVYGLNGTQNGPTGTGAITANMKSRVINIAGLKDFYLTQIDSDYVSLTQADTTHYIPTGSVSEVVAGDPTALAFTRNQQTTALASGSLPFAVATVDAIGLGPLATVYASILEQTATVTNTTAPASNLLSGTQAVASFNGQQSMGTIINSAAAAITNSMGQTGTVEAWIYINSMTDTPGIVHKGTAVDFSDECFSLQGWGSSGQMAIVMDYTGAGNSYDLVTTSKNLNKGKWYYLAATWDLTASPKSLKLYVNGALDGSKVPAVASYRSNTSSVLIGSQLPSIYSSAYGYFGFNGKIVGADVSATAKDAATILATYNAYKGQTSSW